MNGRQSVGGVLLQLVLTLLSVTARNHTEAQLVQVSREEITKPRVTASDVDIFIFLVGHPLAFPVPAIDEPESHQSEDIQEHFSKAKKKPPYYSVCMELNGSPKKSTRVKEEITHINIFLDL